MNAFLKHICLILAASGLCAAAGAQEYAVTAASAEEGSEISTAGIEAQIDSTLYGMDIFSAIPENVVVVQDPAIRSALGEKVLADEQRMTNGFRIRIFIDSRRDAREQSLAVLNRFNAQYPYISVYRSYDAPNFKVSVGNFRNRVEAEQLLAIIKNDYPDAFIVRERFKYPGIGNADTSSLPDSLSLQPLPVQNPGTAND